jgi:predicted DNA-binding protein with PD1-like motif
MRRLAQPGPVPPSRHVAVPGRVVVHEAVLAPGITLNAALTGIPGIAAGCARFAGAVMDPLAYVYSGPAPDAAHAAWYTATHSAPGAARIELAVATVGARDGAPFIHCHAVWRNADGTLAGGHILPHESIVAGAAALAVDAIDGASIGAIPDPETNFTLFEPRPAVRSGATGPRARAARLRPNVAIDAAIAAICAEAGFRRASVAGIGSLVGLRFADGRTCDDIATEMLIEHGTCTEGIVALDIVAIDMAGAIHAGRLARGQNAVCITAELLITERP